MMILGVCLGVAALFVLIFLDDRPRDEDGMPLLDREFTDWRDWDWPGEFRDWEVDDEWR